jgi:hypothetical protein
MLIPENSSNFLQSKTLMILLQLMMIAKKTHPFRSVKNDANLDLEL